VPDKVGGTSRQVQRVAAEPAAEALHRRARLALVVNLVVAVCCFGLVSIPGAVVAGMALRAIPDDLHRADRLVRWSWAFLATNLLFYLLLFAVVATIALIVFLASRSGA
jgi:hypothetical protein